MHMSVHAAEIVIELIIQLSPLSVCSSSRNSTISISESGMLFRVLQIFPYINSRVCVNLVL
jgi:hypothetical protein